jgi:alkylation response protein AidB-like acyl-CoA dehydrogenase
MAADEEALQRAIAEVVLPHADEVDRAGTFPRASLDALADAGILGLVCAQDVGGGGQGLRQAATVVQQLAQACGSTAMVMLMHYAATAVLEAHGPEEIRRSIASGRHLSTLALSEVGSRSHFWAPMSTAESSGPRIRLDARKSWVTSAAEADSFVWSSRPLAAPGPMTLWVVANHVPGIEVAGAFDGLGLRGNGSTPVAADDVEVDQGAMLGADGAGLDVAMATALPWFLVLSGAFCLGLMEAVIDQVTVHLGTTRLEHLDESLIDQPVTRLDLGRMVVTTGSVGALVSDTLNALEAGRPDAMLRVLETKAAAGEAAIVVTDLAMTVCGGAAFRKEVGIERRFRDARAARVMAPTTDALYDLVGRAVSGLPLVG